MEQFLIGNIPLQIDYCNIPVLSEGKLQLFRHQGPQAADMVTLRCSCQPLEQFKTKVISPDNRVYGIYSHQDQPLLIYHWGNLLHGFAVWPHRFSVSFDPKMYNQTPLREDWFFSVCAFHRQLLLRDACVLHASYVDIGGEAILFTGPSGIGKSTQAELWTRYAGAQVINGDRAVLRKQDGRWHVFGYPACGTSGICINRTLPLKAIVVLSQAAENQVRKLSAAEKVRALVSATELYPWDHEEIDMALTIAQNLAMDVPILKLCCRPDQEAVEVLKNYLEENT